MDDEKVKTFLTLASNLSFTKTAFLLHKSQSVVSRQILSMEAEVGFPLFVRDSRYCSLTASGKKLAEGLARLEKDYQKIVSDARLLQEGKSGTLVIGIHGGETTSHYSKLFSTFQRAYPNISMVFVDYRVVELNQRMQDGEIDIAHIVTMGQWFSSSKSLYSTVPAGLRHVCLYIPKVHRHFNTDASRLTLKDFKDDTFLVFSEFETDISTGLTAKYLRSRGVEPITKSCDTLTSAIMMMETGQGIMLSSTHLSISTNTNFRKLYFSPLEPQEEAFAWLPENVNPCIKIFIDYLKQYIKSNPELLTLDHLYP